MMTQPPIREGIASWAHRQVMAVAAALQFFTLIPPLVRRPFERDEIGASVGYFAIPGALVGGILAALQGALLMTPLGPLTRGALVLAAWIIITGALHLDGLLDSCDGLFGGYTPERRLEIMRDHRIGAYALAGGALLLLIKFSALSEMAPNWRLLALVPVAARGGLALAVVAQPYARPQGLGAAFKVYAGWRQAALASALTLLGALWLASWSGLIVIAVTLVTQAVVVALIRLKIPGLTGDSYGAIVELGELGALLCISVL